jgi:sporulation protein YlmC with PRC-barrel domain
MQIGLGAQVVGSDGATIGRVNRLVLDPQTRTLVELIVHQGHVLTQDRLIERDFIAEVAADGVVHLTVTAARADELPRFVRAAYVTPRAGWDAVLYPRVDGAESAGVDVGLSFGAAMPVVAAAGPQSSGFASAPGDVLSTAEYPDVTLESRSNLPTNAVVVGRGTDVVDAAGKKVGEVDDLAFDAAGAITGLYVRGGPLHRARTYVSAAAVAGASPKRVRLNITAGELG